MKSSSIREAENLLKKYRKLNRMRACGATLIYNFLWRKEVIQISNETLKLAVENEKKEIEKRLSELDVEFDE